MKELLPKKTQEYMERAREVANKAVRPVAAELDRSREYPWSVIQALRDADLMGIWIPKEYGGHGAGVLDLCVVVEELSKACGGVGVAYAVNALGSFPVIVGGTEAQKQKWLPPVASGEKLMAGFVMSGGSEHLNENRSLFMEGLAINPGDPRLTALLDFLDEADKQLESVAASGRLTDLQAKAKLGMRRYEQGQPAEALALFDEALGERPEDSNLHYNRLLALRALNRDEELEAGIADFRARFPADDRGASIEGRRLAEAGRYEEALVLFETALALAPDSPVHRNNLAMALAYLERYGEAGEAFAAVCAVSQRYPGAAISAAANYSMAGRTREAAEWMDFCLEHGLAERSQFEERDFFANLRASEYWRD